MSELAPLLPRARHLLPANATPLEKALATASERVDAIPAPIDTLWDPARCPGPLLPWLAWALSVDIWCERWPEAKKRLVCAESITLHRLKGTLEGIRRHVALTDARILKAILPPAKLFAGRRRTLAERQAFLDRHPQLRIYPYRDRAPAAGRSFAGRTVLGRMRPLRSRAAERYGRNAFLYEPTDGSETKLRRLESTQVIDSGVAETVTSLALPRARGRSLVAGDRPRARTFFRARSGARIVRAVLTQGYTLATSALQMRTIAPGLDPIEIAPQRVAVRRPRHAGVFPGDALGRAVLTTRAGAALYDRLYLFDPERPVTGHGATSFVGVGRFGQPAYHADIVAEIRKPRRRRVLGRAASGFWRRTDTTRQRAVRRAVRVAKAARDKILMTTTTARGMRFGDAIRLGDGMSFGHLMRA